MTSQKQSWRSSALLTLLLSLGQAWACNMSSLTLNSQVSLGGNLYQWTVTVCTPGGCDGVDNFGTCIGSQMNDNTGNWAIGIDNSATITGFTPTVTSPQSLGIFNGSLSSANTLVTYTNATQWWSYENTLSIPTNVICGTLVITTNGIPDQMCAYGLEGADDFNVPPACAPVLGTTCIDMTGFPVEFLDFRVEQDGEAAHLYWMTLNEYDHKEFTIEHSTNGFDFAPVGTVPGSGNSNDIRQYDFMHRHLKAGQNSFRVIARDDRGSTFQTNTITLNYSPPSLRFDRLYPNPAHQTTHLEFLQDHDSPGTLRITDGAGRMVREMAVTGRAGRTTLDLEVGDLAPGLYHITLQTDEGWFQTKLVKQ